MTPSPDSHVSNATLPVDDTLARLQAANYYFRVALDQIPESIVILQPDPSEKSSPKVIYSNAPAACLVGVEPGQGLRGMTLRDLAADDASATILDASLAKAVAAGGTDECQASLQCLYGKEKPLCQWRIRAVFNQDRKLLNYTLSFSTVQNTPVEPPAPPPPPAPPEDPEAQAARLRKDNLAALAQGMAHDVNNLLGPATVQLSDVLQRLQATPDLMEQLRVVHTGLRRARQFTSQVVSASQFRPSEFQPTDVATLIRDTVSFAAAGANVEVHVETQPHLRKILANPVRISQVLQNLVMNGIQAMPRGGHLNIEASNQLITPEEKGPLAPGQYVAINIRDRGCGISEENLGRMFQVAFTTKEDGNGIGLTTCQRFIEEHKGHISVNSRLGIGTEFSILLPAAETELPASADALPDEGSTMPVPLVHGQGRIMIVDDEPDLRCVAKMILTRCGYEVFECGSGQEAIKRYQHLSREDMTPDVVLMDLNLRGGINGSETAQEILRYDPDAKLVVTSGSVNEEVQKGFLDRGFVAVLPKPYEAGELTQVVHRITAMIRP